MPVLLRKINVNRWLEKEDTTWLVADAFPADPLGDLVTGKNNLSVWELDDERNFLLEALIAVAIDGQKFDHTGYATINKEDLTQNGFLIKAETGQSPIVHINLLHRHITELSAAKL